MDQDLKTKLPDQKSTDVLNPASDRNRKIIQTSIIGIIANVFLAAFKAVIGVISGSIAITLDAVNNISDAGSSLITIVGTKLAGKDPDKKHPFGYGRIEYLSAMVISIIVLYAGITSLIESVKKIISPEIPEYSVISLVIVAVAVVVKIVLGRYVKSVGEKTNSDSLINSGEDAVLDSIISASTLAAAIIFLISGFSLEAILGAVISAVIIKSGVEMLRDTLSKILGESVDAEFAQEIKETIRSFPDVSGAYDLVLHNYGPDAYQGSVHIEIPDSYTANEIDDLMRQIMIKVVMEHNVILTAIGVYSVNSQDPRVIEVREHIRDIVFAHDNIIGYHGFYLNEAEKRIRFDLVVSFNAGDRRALFNEIMGEIQEQYPGYSIQAAMDTDFSEL